jgi:hypothetical protein
MLGPFFTYLFTVIQNRFVSETLRTDLLNGVCMCTRFFSHEGLRHRVVTLNSLMYLQDLVPTATSYGLGNQMFRVIYEALDFVCSL